MNKKLYAFTINTPEEAESVILACKNYKIKPILYFKKYFLLGFGAEFISIYQAHPNANMYAVCRRNESELNKIASEFNIEKRYIDFHEMLKDPKIDLIHINSPIPDHGWMSIESLKAGKNVMCTVPMSTSIEECKQIVGLVKETGLKYMMAETVVYSREFLFIKEIIY